MIDDIDSQFQDDISVGIAYLYCDFRRQSEQSVETLLASLLKQLAQKRASIPDCVRTFYDQFRNKPKRPTFDEISSILHAVSILYSRVFIIVDALDECKVTNACRKRLLSEIFKLQAGGKANMKANIFSTSRDNPEIVEEFKGSISLKIRAKDEDVQTYLAGHMDRLPSFVSSDLDLQNKIKATISNAVDGMYV